MDKRAIFEASFIYFVFSFILAWGTGVPVWFFLLISAIAISFEYLIRELYLGTD